MRINYQPGVYMHLTDPDALRDWLNHKGMSYEDLGRAVGCSKQFIGMLATGRKRTCTPALAARIEQVLLAAPCRRSPAEKPLFERRVSNQTGDISDSVGALSQSA